MVDALLDWRDPDDAPRRFGAERDWYVARGLFPPRNGPLADVRELRRVRGFDAITVPDSVLIAVFTVEPGRLVTARADPRVLASVTGKQPPEVHMWIAPEPAPVLVRFEGALFVDGPAWRIELGAPRWKD